MTPRSQHDSIATLLTALQEARARTLELVAGLSDEQMIGPRLEIVNPLRWEIAHVAWFQEYWVLRRFRGEPPTWPEADRLYDSASIPHDTRWDLPLPSRAATLNYIQRILERLLESNGDASRTVEGYDEAYYLRLALMHEYMHDEAITYTRQTLAYPAPQIGISAPSGAMAQTNSSPKAATGPQPLGDAEIPGGAFLLGSQPGAPFVFDNEQWAHPVSVPPFRMARAAVTNAQFAAFVEDGGYRQRRFWTEEGWQWRERVRAERPAYWRRESDGQWLRRNFDVWTPVENRHPVLHVNWHEADAFCRWAGRRLPTEAEWEMAASAEPAQGGSGVAPRKRSSPWGDEPPTSGRANLDWRTMGCVDACALAAGDSAFGCRQMTGNVWEWTASGFTPYPGFAPGPYKEYSAPWFGDHKVLRGGCWATRSGLIRNTYRNFYQPHRRDVWAGFRTCAAESARP